MKWYYAMNGQRQGPVAEIELERLAGAGVITAQTLVWREGMKEWQPYATVRPAPVPPEPVEPPVPPSDDFEICVVSGKRYARREMIQFDGKWISLEHRDTFFQKMRKDSPQAGALVYAAMGKRFAAKLIDFAILAIPYNMVAAQFDVGWFAPTLPPPQTLEEMGELLGSLMSAMMATSVIGLIYSWSFLSRFQATPGKLLLKLKVVRADGSKLSTGGIVGRFFAEMVSALTIYIGYIAAFFDEPEHRALHDRMVGTRVVSALPPSA